MNYEKPLLSQNASKHQHRPKEIGYARTYKNGLILRFIGNDCLLELTPETATIAGKKLKRPYAAIKLGRKDGDRFIPVIEPDNVEFAIICAIANTSTASVLNKAGSLSQHVAYSPEYRRTTSEVRRSQRHKASDGAKKRKVLKGIQFK